MLPIVHEFGDGFVDIVKCKVGMLFFRKVRFPRIPTINQLFERAHIDIPIVEMPLDTRHVLDEESPVLADRVAAQRCLFFVTKPPNNAQQPLISLL